MPTDAQIKSIIHNAITLAYQKPNSSMGENVYIGQSIVPEITNAVFKALKDAGYLCNKE